jgi:hypothetical protein
MNFRDVINYENYYKVSDCGVVFSKDRVQGNRTIKARKMALVSNGTGYLQVTLNLNNTRKKIYIHRLVWEMFNGPIPKGYEIDHINCNKADNQISNLQLMTRKENMSKCLKDNPHIENNLLQNKNS